MLLICHDTEGDTCLHHFLQHDSEVHRSIYTHNDAVQREENVHTSKDLCACIIKKSEDNAACLCVYHYRNTYHGCPWG